ncbi:MarR family winged helix-turn-helix transcriptional regulator [Corynebacterium liangguodongii]|uniref:MarR family transcriptional regulator n=1 Tax=Corynebacterium liangguodongii TaxID=2079535 RepID=A0A2S0WGL2_9CORY|nr:MarR family winged helix-turn-helix transcriptional regulator [Corynebacterium liangguodongii]AWB84903.1 MarR family transcriptional regulator [Corynebacterium liangguodongii]PWB99389.1 MarR family transcriptional regulator [Corynebacterium liangguodongii]
MDHNEPTDPAAPPAPDPYAIAQRIRPAATSLYVMYFRTAHQSDLTGPQLSIMTRLKHDGPCRINRLAEAEGVRMPTASNTVNQLEKRGLVTRVRDDADRRGVSVQLTTQGEAELLRVGEERTKYLAEMLGTLPEEELRRFDEAADIINTLADHYVNDRNSDSAH